MSLMKVTLEKLKEVDRNDPPFTPCTCCGQPTYDGTQLDKAMGPSATGFELPEGFTVANRRRYVQIHRVNTLVCTKCRFDEYGAF